jgi:hypothetical protein
LCAYENVTYKIKPFGVPKFKAKKKMSGITQKNRLALGRIK